MERMLNSIWFWVVIGVFGFAAGFGLAWLQGKKSK